MKLLIELGEKRFEDIKRIASIQIRRKSLTCEQIIANGTPLEEELEQIKEEIKGLAFDYVDFSADKELVVDLDNIEEVIDKHISELKGCD